jgi:DNA-binding NarL/FixJ family response regulator
MKLENVKVTKKSEEKATTIISNESLSKSQKMKDLFDLGFEVKEIAARMNVRYNFVYNVVSNYVIVSDLKVENTKVDSKKDKVVELFNLGKSNKEIAIELKTTIITFTKLQKS